MRDYDWGGFGCDGVRERGGIAGLQGWPAFLLGSRQFGEH